MIQIEKCGQIVKRSKNLRWLLDYARLYKPVRIEIRPQGEAGRLRVFFSDGASCSAAFWSYQVLIKWVDARKSWVNAEKVIYQRRQTMNEHNIRKKDIAANRNYCGMWVLSTIHNGYFKKHVSDDTLKNARVEFIMKLRGEK